MDLGFVFKLSLYGLTALVGAILGAAEGEGTVYGAGRLSLPFLSLPIVVCGYLTTEQRPWGDRTRAWGLSATWANVLGIIALVATGFEFFGHSREAKLLAGTHLLLYATWIVMFQQKTVRLYWFSMALGILQLAVASVLTTKGWFGFSALVYTFGAVWTLSIFSLWRAEQQFKDEERKRLIDTSLRKNSPQVAASRRAKLASEVRGAVQHEGGTQWLTVRFVTGVLLTTCSALIVSAGFFAFIPRVWVGPSVSFSDDQVPLSGAGKKAVLGTTVRLGELGPILESTDRVFDIRIIDRGQRKTISAQEYADQLGLAEPLFRAAVLTTYEKGQWGTDPRNIFLGKPFELRFKDPEIQQLIHLEPNAPDILFCMGKPLLITVNNQAVGEFNESTGVATFAERKRENTEFEYAVYSSRPATPPRFHKFEINARVKDSYRKTNYLKKNLWLPRNLERLKALTREIVQNETARRQRLDNLETPRTLTSLEIASALNEYLLDPKLYSYTLDQSIQDPLIDPVEDFLFNRKSGHCEYFATALTLMLRAADIPARMISGYKGGEPHPQKKDWLQIQQRFAHVWVEAWVDDQGWTTFDPTPADARSVSVASVGAKKTSLWNDVQTTLSGLWSDNILNMSLDRQEASIYKPMRKLGISLLTFFRQLFTSPRSAFQTFLELLKNRESWFSLGGGLFALVFMICLTGLVLLSRWLFSRLCQWWAVRSSRRYDGHSRIVEFYQRFVQLMQTRGLKRAPTQTQREFAESVASAFSPELSASGLTEIPQRISKFFYEVRFGEQSLSTEEINQIEKLLIELEKVLSMESNRKETLVGANGA